MRETFDFDGDFSVVNDIIKLKVIKDPFDFLF